MKLSVTVAPTIQKIKRYIRIFRRCAKFHLACRGNNSAQSPKTVCSWPSDDNGAPTPHARKNPPLAKAWNSSGMISPSHTDAPVLINTVTVKSEPQNSGSGVTSATNINILQKSNKDKKDP